MSSVKVSGTWKDIEAPYVKVGGSWNIAKSAWTKLSGEWRSWFLQDGVLDAYLKTAIAPDFTTNGGTGFNSQVSAVALQPDGKLLVGGSFTTFNGTTVNRIARLNSDGTLDTNFATNIGTGASSSINAIALQSDGKILIGGAFTSFNGNSATRIARLNSDGTLDTNFTTNTGTGANTTVWSIAIQPDAKILIGGAFSTFNGTTVGFSGAIIRLNSNGSLDTAFTTNGGTGVSNDVYAIALQSDGKILIGGSFFTYNGTNSARIARLNSDGTLDTNFATNIGTGGNGSVRSIALQSDGKILVGGFFSAFNGTTAGTNGGIIRLNSNGSLDTAFTTNGGTGVNFYVYAIALQSDGKILVGGIFTTFNGTTVNRIARLNSDGTLDTAFTANTGTGASSTVLSIVVQPDGKILVAGSFSTFNLVNTRIARLNSDGSGYIGSGFDSNVYAIALQPDGKLLVGGSFAAFGMAFVNRIVRINSDGTADTNFDTNIGTGASSLVRSIAVQPDGKILLGGSFTTFNGTTVNRIARLNSDGTLDTSFATNIGTGASDTVYAIALQSDGKILIGGAFSTFNGTTVGVSGGIVRLNSNGSLDTAFINNGGLGVNNDVYAVAVQPDGKILIGGSFTSFDEPPPPPPPPPPPRGVSRGE